MSIQVTIVIPVSREDHLDRLFASLEMLKCRREEIGLLTYVDGGAGLFLKTRNLTESSKFAQRRCIPRPADNGFREYSIAVRRRRIASIHNELRELVPDCKYVFMVEDDTMVPPHALEKLLSAYTIYPFAGFVEGAEVGRWGIPMIGAWMVDDPYDPKLLKTFMPDQGVKPIDAGGFYCTLTKREHCTRHEFKPFGDNDLGPDVNYGLSLRQQGFINYIDWDVRCQHRTEDKVLTLANSEVKQVVMTKEGQVWKREAS